MSTTQLVGGVIAASVVVQGLVALALPDLPPITVHELTYKDGIMHQGRTIETEDEFFPAEWRAAIYDVDTNEPVDGCVGSGFWNYTAGYLVADMTLMRWTGADTCTPDYLRLLGGEFYPVASWHWGNDGTQKRGKNFKP